MTDSRDKGTRAEYQVRDLLRKQTGLEWQRVPGSGGFNASHGLKGDIYVPEVNIKHCIEVKHYEDDTINCNLLNESTSQLEKFWLQTVRESEEINKEPLLVFRKNRGKWIVATREQIMSPVEMIFTSDAIEETINMYLFSTWLAEQTEETVCNSKT